MSGFKLASATILVVSLAFSYASCEQLANDQHGLTAKNLATTSAPVVIPKTTHIPNAPAQVPPPPPAGDSKGATGGLMSIISTIKPLAPTPSMKHEQEIAAGLKASDIKVVDTNSRKGAAAMPEVPADLKPVVKEVLANKQLMNDSKNTIVILDNSANKPPSTQAPFKLPSVPAAAKLTELSGDSKKSPLNSGASPTTAKPGTSKAALPTTAAPAASTEAPKSKSAAPTSQKPSGPEKSSTGKPSGGARSVDKLATSTAPHAMSTGAPKLDGNLPSMKPETGESKSAPKVEKESKNSEKPEKKEDKDGDSKNAIKSLQEQRSSAHGGPSDARLHQLEHERQMSVDPVGHTLKHKEYELKKAASAARSKLLSPSTTKKPAQ